MYSSNIAIFHQIQELSNVSVVTAIVAFFKFSAVAVQVLG